MKLRILSAALLGLLVGGAANAQPYYPPGPPPPPPPGFQGPDFMQRLKWSCDRGDRRACIRFGIEIGRHEDRVGDWRRAHPDWFFYER